MSEKIREEHQQRSAAVYIRQSTMAQVLKNQESQKRQYALAERARELGFQQVEVIDEDPPGPPVVAAGRVPESIDPARDYDVADPV